MFLRKCVDKNGTDNLKDTPSGNDTKDLWLEKQVERFSGMSNVLFCFLKLKFHNVLLCHVTISSWILLTLEILLKASTY